MTRDDIIRWAQESGFGGQARITHLSKLTAFAQQAAAFEREACARVLADFERFGDTRDCIAAIQARGNK